MKTLFLLPALLFTSQMAMAQSFSNAIDYNDYIVDLQNQIAYKILTFNEQMALEESTLESIQPYYDDLVETSKECLVKLKNIEAFEDDAELKPAAVNLFDFYVRCFSTSYNEMLHIVYRTELNDEDYNELNTILEKVTSEEGQYDEDFNSAQIRFAEKYDFTLDENELQEEIDE